MHWFVLAALNILAQVVNAQRRLDEKLDVLNKMKNKQL